MWNTEGDLESKQKRCGIHRREALNLVISGLKVQRLESGNRLCKYTVFLTVECFYETRQCVSFACHFL